MKTYTYQVFLRCPNTKEVQYGTIEFDSDGDFMSVHELVRKLNSGNNLQKFNEGYTLIGLNVIRVDEVSSYD